MLTKNYCFCDQIANGTDNDCFGEGSNGSTFPGPNSDRYVQECNDIQCQDVSADDFNLKVTDDKEFQGSEEGTKIDLDGKGFVVDENSRLGSVPEQIFNCIDSGFDTTVLEFVNDESVVQSCVLFEGDCVLEI